MTCFSAFFTEKDGKSCFGTGKRWEKLFLRQKHDLTRKQHAEHPFAGRNTQHSCLVQGGLLLVESGLWFWNKVVKVEYYWKCNKFSNWSLIAEVEICRFQISRVKKIVFSTVFTLEGLIPVWAKHTVGILLFTNMLSQYNVYYLCVFSCVLLAGQWAWFYKRKSVDWRPAFARGSCWHCPGWRGTRPWTSKCHRP